MLATVDDVIAASLEEQMTAGPREFISSTSDSSSPITSAEKASYCAVCAHQMQLSSLSLLILVVFGVVLGIDHLFVRSRARRCVLHQMHSWK